MKFATFAVSLILMSPADSHASTLFVNQSATGANDGTRWEDAFVNLQTALSAAVAGDEIWVAAGTYTPAPPDGLPDLSFAIPSGVRIYGGFSGQESSLDQRDPAANVTTLSGDLNHDDTAQFVMLPNSWHVVTMIGVNASTRLDGFEIAHGYTFFGPGNEQSGGGLRISGGSPTIANCTFTTCFARTGGGVFAASSNAIFENCRFTDNWASDWVSEGGALYIAAPGVVTVRHSTFSGNVAEGNGGWSFGGGIYSEPDTEITVDRCDFTGNTALHRSTGGISWCHGGAVYVQGNTTISNSTFSGNISNVAGAVQSWTTPPNWTRIRNCSFRNNDAIGTFIGGEERDGAAGTIAGGGELDIFGCVVYGGFSDNYGGVWVGAGATVSGSIFWNNSDSAGSIGRSNIRADGPVAYSCVQNMLVGLPGETPPDPANFPGSIDLDPLFSNEVMGDYRLTSASPCIDAGDNSGVPFGVTADLDGRPRFIDTPETSDTGDGIAPIVDMGPFEFGMLADGDGDGDSDADVFDFSRWLDCVTGPNAGPMTPACEPFDFDDDADADLADFAGFQRVFDGGPPPLDPTGAITGTVSYGGAPTGLIHVKATNYGMGQYTYETSFSTPGPYTLNVDRPAEYFVSTFMDTNGNGTPDADEPASSSPSNPVSISQAGDVAAGVNMSLGGELSISGSVMNPAGNPVFNAALTLSGTSDSSTTTDQSGHYSFAHLAQGVYTVTPSAAWRYSYPYNATVELKNSDVIGVDFESHTMPTGVVDGELSGTVTAVDPENYNITVAANGGEGITLFVFVDTVYSGAASTLDEVQVGYTIQAQYYTMEHLAVEIDTEP